MYQVGWDSVLNLTLRYLGRVIHISSKPLKSFGKISGCYESRPFVFRNGR